MPWVQTKVKGRRVSSATFRVRELAEEHFDQALFRRLICRRVIAGEVRVTHRYVFPMQPSRSYSGTQQHNERGLLLEKFLNIKNHAELHFGRIETPHHPMNV